MSTNILDDNITNPQLVIASKGQRFANRIIDIIFIMIVGFTLMFSGLLAVGSSAGEGTFNLVFYGIYFFYFFITEAALKAEQLVR